MSTNKPSTPPSKPLSKKLRYRISRMHMILALAKKLARRDPSKAKT